MRQEKHPWQIGNKQFGKEEFHHQELSRKQKARSTGILKRTLQGQDLETCEQIHRTLRGGAQDQQWHKAGLLFRSEEQGMNMGA